MIAYRLPHRFGLLPAEILLGMTPHRLGLARKFMARETAATACRDRPVDSRLRAALEDLRAANRGSVFIVDARCGDGARLIAAARLARRLGFVAIDCKGFDTDPRHVAAARGMAGAVRDPAIGFEFARRTPGAPLPLDDEETDILLDPANLESAREARRLVGRDGIVLRG